MCRETVLQGLWSWTEQELTCPRLSVASFANEHSANPPSYLVTITDTRIFLCCFASVAKKGEVRSLAQIYSFELQTSTWKSELFSTLGSYAKWHSDRAATDVYVREIQPEPWEVCSWLAKNSLKSAGTWLSSQHETPVSAKHPEIWKSESSGRHCIPLEEKLCQLAGSAGAQPTKA